MVGCSILAQFRNRMTSKLGISFRASDISVAHFYRFVSYNKSAALHKRAGLFIDEGRI